LSLMLTNLPVHFADPEFREDAVRGIRRTAARIDQLISRAGSLQSELELNLCECDLNAIVAEAVAALKGAVSLEFVENFGALPTIIADREQIQSVVTNLLLNASEAKGTTRVTVSTEKSDGWVGVNVGDDGCGMSPGFIRKSLFRPFETTKKNGLGVGMFQSRMIIEAHYGKISVTSQPGLGTTFHVLLPTGRPAR